MKISIKQYQNKTAIQVRHLSQQQLCEEKLAKILGQINNINNQLRSYS